MWGEIWTKHFLFYGPLYNDGEVSNDKASDNALYQTGLDQRDPSFVTCLALATVVYLKTLFQDPSRIYSFSILK